MATAKKKSVLATKSFSNSGAVRSIRVRDYFNTALKSYSLANNIRQVPLLADGMKPSQRKAIYGALLRGESAGEMQVERLAADFAAKTDYHHGATSLETTITNMAVNLFPNSNNMNLFVPEGQFGSRLTKEAGAGRYIFTFLSKYFRALFKKEDDAILEYNYSDGSKIEPKHFLPILPLSLINGSNGTGTGHSSKILCYHPNQVRDLCVAVLNGKKLVKNELTPWFRGFNGTVERNKESGQVITTGKLEVVNSTTIHITELPIGVFLDDYKEVLNNLEKEEFIKDYSDSSTEQSFSFTVTCPRTTTALDMDKLMTKFKLIGRFTENFTLWFPGEVLKRLESAEEVIEMFVNWRVGFYEIRRQKLISDLSEQLRFLRELIRFIEFFISNMDLFREATKKELIEMMTENGFTDYEKLLGMPLWSLTRDRIEESKQKAIATEQQIAVYENDTSQEMFLRELKEFKYTTKDEDLFA